MPSPLFTLSLSTLGADRIGRSPCAALPDSAEVCCWTLRVADDADTPEITAMAADQGGAGTPVRDLPGFELWGVDSLGQEGTTLYTCDNGSERVLGIDLASGLITNTDQECGAVSTWRGEDARAGGIVVLPSRERDIWYYPSFADLAAGAGGEVLDASYLGTRMTIADDVAFTTWHAGSTVRLAPVEGEDDLDGLVLEDFDTWIWGLSVVDGTLYVLDDGRSDDHPGVTRIVAFDVETGDQLGFVALDGGYTFQGLDCRARGRRIGSSIPSVPPAGRTRAGRATAGMER